MPRWIMTSKGELLLGRTDWSRPGGELWGWVATLVTIGAALLVPYALFSLAVMYVSESPCISLRTDGDCAAAVRDVLARRDHLVWLVVLSCLSVLVSWFWYQQRVQRWRFAVPPGWPQQPASWVPPRGWRPDPSWPAPPEGWRWWVRRTEQDEAPAVWVWQRGRRRI